VDQAFSPFAENSLKRAAAPCTVHCPVLRPLGVPAVEIAEFHHAMPASFFPSFLSILQHPVHRFPVVIAAALRYETVCYENPVRGLGKNSSVSSG
jgi:hypothetical protein